MDTTYIETERLILRSWRVTDRAVFAEINSNNKVMKYFPKPLSIEESNGFVDRINSEFEETGFGLYAVEIKETGIAHDIFHSLRLCIDCQTHTVIWQYCRVKKT